MAWFNRDKSHSPVAGVPALPPRRPLVMALEARVMFDGAAAAAAVTLRPEPAAHAAPAVHGDATHAAVHRPAAVWADDVISHARLADHPSTGGTASRSVLFVDARVQDAAALLAHARTGTEVVYLQQGRDGLAQMRDYLDAHPGADSVQILAHGHDGDLWLGNTYLSATSIRTHAVELQQIDADVKAGGNIQVYAIDTAAGGKGPIFIGSLAELTGRDAATSGTHIDAGHGDQKLTGETPARLAVSQTRVMDGSHDAVTQAADKQVVFINSNVADLQSLVAGLPAGEHYVLLDSTKDGLLQIEQYLQAHPGVSAIHLVSHGATGEFQVGSTWISEADFSTYSADFAQIGAAMKAGGDFLIYGCDVAGNADGKALVQQISSISGLNVAASTDATGATTLGGDWVLEYDAGTVHTEVAFSAASERSYDHVLSAYDETYDGSVGFDTGSTPVVSTTLDSLIYTGDQAVEYQVVSGSLPASGSGGELIVNTQGTQMSSMTIARQDGGLMAMQSFDIDIFVSNQVTVQALDGSGSVIGSIVLDINAGATAYTPGHTLGSSLFHVNLSGNAAFSQVKSIKLVETSGNGTFLSPTLDNLTYLAPSSPPTLTASGGTTSFVAGDNVASTPVVIDSGITLTDGNSTTAVSATVSITGNLHNAEDVLGFTNTSAATYGNIAASYSAATGVLTLTSAGGTATIAQWQAALRAVTYTDTAVTPNSATRTISFEITNDGFTAGNTTVKAVSVTDTDQTPIVTTTGSTTNYSEGAAAITIDSGITVSDHDNTTQASGRVSVSGGFHSGDTLGFTNNGSTMGNITASYNAATGVLTLTSAGATATDAQWAAALKAVTFSSTSTTLGARTISFSTNDGTKTSAAATDTINVVTPVQVTTDSGSAAFVAGDNTASTPVTIDSGLTVTDTAAATLGSATVAITGGFQGGQDVLAFTNDGSTMGNITASYDGATGVLTLTSAGATATLAQWQSALRSVTYTDTLVTPNSATRTVSFSVVDSASNASVAATRTVTVTDTDQTPIVTTTGGTTNYVGATSAVAIDGGITISDLDNTTQSSGTVSVSSGFHSGDTLGFTNDGVTMGNITASYNAGTGVLTLTSAGATATEAQWTSALKAVTFSSTSTTYGNRTISFTTSDGTKTAAAATDTIHMTAPPTITTDSGSAAFVSGDNATSTPVAVDAGLTVTDGSATTLASASVAITGGFLSGEDVLAFTNDGSTMGNITASYNASTGMLTLSSAGATATLAQWQSALRSVTYTDTAVTPNTATRTIGYTTVDGAGNTSATATRTVTVTATDQTPIVGASGGTTNYVGGTAGVTIDGGITVSDLDNSTQSSGTVSVSGGFHSGDTLGFTNDGLTMGNIVGSYNAATGVLTLTSSGATATDAQWANALKSVTFSSTSTTYGNRTISFSTSDGTKTSTPAIDTVTVLGPPTITTDSGSATFVAGDNTASTPVAIDAGLTVTDGAASTLSSATVAITGNFHSGEDVLGFANTSSATYGNIAASYNAGTGVLTLSSSGNTATLAQWQAALDAVTYTDTAVTPNTATRTISFAAVDAAAVTSNTATRTVTITDTDQTPIVTTTGGTTHYVGGTSAVTIDGGITVSDLDNATQSSGTVSITSGFHSGDTLTFVNTNSATFGNIVGSYNAATGVLTLTSSGATATDAQWASALSAVTFSAGSSATPGDRMIAFATNDGTKTSAMATDTVSVLGPPTITTDSGSAAFVAGDNAASTPVVIDAGLTVTDGAASTLSSATVAITGNFHSGEDVLGFVNTSSATYGNIAASYNAATGVLTLSSSGNTATLAQWQAALDSVTYTDTAVTPNAATRTISFTAVDATAVTSNTATRTVTVTDTDQTPIVTTTGGTTDYVFSAAPATIDSGVSVSDADNATQSSATVTIGTGFHNGDMLSFTNDGTTMGNITASYDAATGVLTLTSSGATATDAQWSNALSAVAFSSTSTSYGNRTIAFATSDGTKTSAVATDTVDLLSLPKVTNVSSTTSDGSYKMGDTIYLTVSFDQTVTVDTAGGSPVLHMETGSVDHDAVYVSGSGGDTLTFAYTVQAGDASPDLDYTSTTALALDGGTIRSAQGVDAVLTLPTTGSGTSIAGQHAIVVDGIAPTVVSVGAPATGTYRAGQSLDFTVNYSEAVTVDASGGTPRIAVTLDTGGTVYADYVSGSGTTALVFRYTVATGQADPDGVALAGAIQLNGGDIHDSVGNAGVDTLAGVASTAGVHVDAVGPTASIVIADPSLKAGETSRVTITFSEAVSGLATTDFAVANGSLSDLASNDGGITWTATFAPTGDVTAASNVITLDMTSVADAFGNAGHGTTTSNNYAVDTHAPQVVAIGRSDASPNSGRQGLDYTVTFDEDVSGVDAANFTLATTGSVHAVIADVTRVDGHTYAVHLDHVGGTGNLQLDLVAAGSGITDAAGNVLTSGAQGQTYVVGGVSPTVLPPVAPMPTTAAFAHDPAVSLVTTISTAELPTIYFGEAAPPRSVEWPLPATGGVLDGLAMLASRSQGTAERAVWADPGWPGLLPIEANTAFDIPLSGLDILQVSAADGRPLPSWLVFDPVAGTLAGTPPRDFTGALTLVLTIRDSHGQVHDIPLQLAAAKASQVSHESRSAVTAKPALAQQFGTQRHGGDHSALLRQLAVAQRQAASAPVHP